MTGTRDIDFDFHQEPTMHPIRIAPTLAFGILAAGLSTPSLSIAQEPGAGKQSDKPAAVEAINASYQRQLRDLESRWIADLAALAEKGTGPESDAAYRQLFGLAIAHELCPAAQPAARRCLESTSAARDVRALAALVQTRSPESSATWLAMTKSRPKSRNTLKTG
jgi:hypothetical protein